MVKRGCTICFLASVKNFNFLTNGVSFKSASKNDLRICDNSDKVTTGSWLRVDYTTGSLLDCSYF